MRISLIIMEEFTLPDIPNDFWTGQPFVGAIHPSLLQLNAYITRKFKHDFVGVNTVALTEYMTASGNYYLFGQIPIDANVPLTNSLLRAAIDAHHQRLVDYGEPYNQFEAANIEHSITVFHNLLYLLRRYYQHPYDLMEMYKPGGEFIENLIEDSCYMAL